MVFTAKAALLHSVSGTFTRRKCHFYPVLVGVVLQFCSGSTQQPCAFINHNGNAVFLYSNHFVPHHLRNVTKMVGIQIFPADGDKVAISQERQYAKV